MNWRMGIVAALAVLALVIGLARLEEPRADLVMRDALVGETPVTVMHLSEAQGPVVVIAHGFAGSRQLMAAWQLSLARAGFITVSFDFAGHGRNPVPMSGDVTRIDGTTRLLMEETGRVTDFAVTPARCCAARGAAWPFHGVRHRGAARACRSARGGGGGAFGLQCRDHA